ncbi:MAG: histidine phosphatase family protein [Chloroflexi bacterium]|nr:histidine phosphatase family protein [Chloroflexota bacterium]MYK60896.1 histidine phosphatase family protein [Chloroflexota bacterium]
MSDHNSTNTPRIFNPSPRTIIMVRHGETEGNLDDKSQGHFDAQLTERGRIQAEAVAERLSDTQFDAVYSSDLQRALDTAKAIVAHHPELQIHTRSQLREYHFGDYEDKDWDSVGDADADLYKRWKNLNTRASIKFPGGESMLDAWERVGRVVEEILTTHHKGNESLLVVGHGGSLQAVLARLMNLRITDQWSFVFNNTSVTVLHEHLYTPNGWRMIQFNDTSHLNGIGFTDNRHVTARKPHHHRLHL